MIFQGTAANSSSEKIVQTLKITIHLIAQAMNVMTHRPYCTVVGITF